MKKSWHRTRALFSTLLALLLFLPCGYPAWAAEALILEIPLLSPVIYTSKTSSPTTEEQAIAQIAIRSISQTAYDAFLMDCPLQSMWIDIRGSWISASSTLDTGSGNRYHWRIDTLNNHLVTREEFSDPKGMTERLQRVVESFTPTGTTLYDRVLSIHDYVCASTVYDLTGCYVYSAYGALVDKRSVCEGYAEAFKLLCDQNGIPCVLVSGTGITSSGEENHMWNYVLMDDGKWYAVDTTWDDGKEILRSYFLIGSDTVVNSRNGKLFSENHKPDGDISRTGLKAFAYPSLSANAYTVNNPQAVATASEAGANNRWFYDQLDAEQKNFYDRLMTFKPPKGKEETTTKPITTTEEPAVTTPDATTPNTTTPDTSTPDATIPDTSTPDTTTPDTTTPDTTTPDTATPDTTTPNTSTPDTTTPNATTPDTTTPDTSTPDTTTSDATTPDTTTPDDTTPDTTTPDTTTPDTTTPNATTPPVTTPDDTTPKPNTTKPSVTTPSNTTVPITTETDPVPTQKPTDPITAESNIVGETVESTVTNELPTTLEITETESTDRDGQTLTNDMAVSLDGRPESPLDTTKPAVDGDYATFGYILRVIVIVLALLALFALIALTVIRFDRKQP